MPIENVVPRSGPVSVLFTHYGDQWLRGSETLLLDLLTHLDPRRVKPIIWCNAPAMADASRSAGFTTYRTDFHFYFDYDSPRLNIAQYWSLVQEGIGLVRKHNVHVLHANSAAPNQWLFPVARLTRCPLLTHLHIDYLRRSRYALLLHQAQLIVGVSRQVVESFNRDGLPPQRTAVIYNGIDAARLVPRSNANLRAELRIPDNAIVIATIGSLIKRKGQDLLIRALAHITAVHLIIVSDGPERNYLEQLADELGLRKRIHFLGYYNDISSVYRHSDIVALASRADAFGLVLAEAGFFGLPVVSTTVGGIPEVVENGVTGLLVPPDDIPALTDALLCLIDNPTYRKQLGAAAKERVEKLFSVEQMVTEFEQTYERLALLPRKDLGWLSMTKTFRPYLRLLRLRQRPA